MTLNPEEKELLSTLPGIWRVGATNFPIWIEGLRVAANYQFTPIPGRSFTLAETISWSTPAGVSRTVLGVARYKNGGFSWRARRLLRVVTGRWVVASFTRLRSDIAAGGSVANTSAASDLKISPRKNVASLTCIAVIRFERTRFIPEGINILVRHSPTLGEEELRSIRVTVAGHPEAVGLSSEEFASLTWLNFTPSHPAETVLGEPALGGPARGSTGLAP